MKKIIMVLGVMALLALAGISVDVVNAKPEGQELAIDKRITFLVPGSSRTLNEGEVEYTESVVFSVIGTVVYSLPEGEISCICPDSRHGSHRADHRWYRWN